MSTLAVAPSELRSLTVTHWGNNSLPSELLLHNSKEDHAQFNFSVAST